MPTYVGQVKRAVAAGYDRPFRMTYSYAEHDFGAGAGTHYVKPPYGLNNGRVEEIQVDCTENFTADTTPGYVQVGIAADADKYAQLTLGTDADSGEAYGSADSECFKESNGTERAMIDFSGDGATIVKFVAPTGGTPAGKGIVHIVIAWF